MKLQFTIFILIVLDTSAFAQDTTKQQGNDFAFSGFVEVYYAYDLNKPFNHNRPFFLYNHHRHNEFNVNLAYLKSSYNAERVRANIALATGTYMNANYAAEQGVLKNIYEANAGVKISKAKNIWIDAGILSSHIGFESAHSPSCWTLTRSIMAENSPYYESGAKLTYLSADSKLLLSGLALNGWQRIHRAPGNSLMSWGTQVQYKPSKKATLNYSTFFGTDTPDSMRLWRYFHDIYGVIQFTDKLGLIIGVDIGLQQKNKGSNKMNTWYGGAGLVRYALNDDWSVALRYEYYKDKAGVIILSVTTHGFNTSGVSLNIDRSFGENMFWRTELRTLKSKDAIFIKDDMNLAAYDTAITTSIALTFNSTNKGRSN